MQTSSILVGTAYHQYWLEWGEWDPLAIPFKGGNGLVWNSPGRVVVLTGTDSGDVPVEFVVCDSEPQLDLEAWDEVVEISIKVAGAHLAMTIPDGIEIGAISIPAAGGETVECRLRIQARGRDAGSEAEFIDADEGDELVEQHLILIWLAPSAVEVQHKLTDTVGANNRSHT